MKSKGQIKTGRERKRDNGQKYELQFDLHFIILFK